MNKTRKVALLIETSNSYARELLHGIHDFSREHQLWTVYVPEQSRGQPPPSWLQEWHGHGIIARIENLEIAQAVRRTKLPAVDVSAARLVPKIPWVETNDDAIARLAADHFLERGFRNFACYSDEQFNWSKWRQNAFAECVTKAGFACSTLSLPSRDLSWEKGHSALARWISKLPKPLGIFATYDTSALQLLETCRRIGLSVPDSVAVLGVNNDELLCDLADPPLSSIIPNARRAGYEAAVLLEKMMNGAQISCTGSLFEPLGVATRLSTDVLAVSDPHISEALRLIREHACEGIKINDVLRHVPLSRRVFESRFKKLIGRTPHEQILLTKLRRAKLLLTESDLSVARIAERTGFPHVEYMTVAFKRTIGVAPREWRNQNVRRSK